VPFEAASKHTPHLQPSWSHSKQPRKIPFTRNPLGASLTCLHQRGSRDTVKNMEGVSNALCIQPRVFDTRLSNSPYANFALLYVNSRVDKKQGKVDTPTTLCSRLLKSRRLATKGTADMLQVSHSVPRPSLMEAGEGSPKRVASEAYVSRRPQTARLRRH